MPRVKTGTTRRRRHKKVLKLAEGYYGGRRRFYRRAKETLDRAGVFAYAHRRLKKREFRALWQTRVSAALKAMGLSYSKVIHQLKQKGIGLNRKMLANLALTEPNDFKTLIGSAQG